MNTSKNDITGDDIKTGLVSEKYRDGWDTIFGQKKKKENDKEDSLDGKDEQENAF